MNFWELGPDYLELFDEPSFESISGDSVIRMIHSSSESTTIYRIQNANERKTLTIKTGIRNLIKRSYLDVTNLSQQEIERLSTFDNRPWNASDSAAYWKAYVPGIVDSTYTEQVFELRSDEWDNIFKLINPEFYQLPNNSDKAGSDGFTWSFEVRTSIGEHNLERWTPDQVSDPIVHELGSTIERTTYNTRQLSGTVINQNNEPIKKAVIKFAEPRITIKSNKYGEFRIHFPLLLLTGDKLKFEISKRKYQSIEKTISVGDLPTNLNVELLEKK